MKFYKIETTLNIRMSKLIMDDHDSRFEKCVKSFKKKAKALSADVNVGPDMERYICFSDMDENGATIIAVTKNILENSTGIQNEVKLFLKLHRYKCDIERCSEITFKSWMEFLSDAESKDFIDDDDEILHVFGLSALNRRWQFDCTEYMLDDESPSLESALTEADGLLSIDSLKAELHRIYHKPEKKWRLGNPVHYVISADGRKDGDEYLRLLLKALRTNNRIAMRRFTLVDYENMCDDYSHKKHEALYRVQTGGVVVIRVRKETARDDEYVTGSEGCAGDVCKMAMEWKNKVITVFMFPRESERLRKVFFDKMYGISLIHVEERAISGDPARKYLAALAKKHETRAYKSLLNKVEEGESYSKDDLRKIYDLWFDNYLKTRIYPQYTENVVSIQCDESLHAGSGIKKLRDLIGLTETKVLVEDILNYAKVRELYMNDGKRRRQSMHMIFSGNPGTAKTTVARIMSKILKENGVLKNGTLVEVGRADLVGRYVGWTAPTVKEAFEKAEGGVLFIDEAYSLVEGKAGLFGEEAINTIVQEMENRRDEVVVVFAGYPDKMEGFLQKNPGLRSRIGFHVNFPDYSPQELYGILELLTKDEEIVLAGDVRAKVMPILEQASRVKEFGNGRYVRNLLEKACMRQATRLLKTDKGKLTNKEIATLIADDFEEVRLSGQNSEGTRIGFG